MKETKGNNDGSGRPEETLLPDLHLKSQEQIDEEYVRVYNMKSEQIKRRERDESGQKNPEVANEDEDVFARKFNQNQKEMGSNRNSDLQGNLNQAEEEFRKLKEDYDRNYPPVQKQANSETIDEIIADRQKLEKDLGSSEESEYLEILQKEFTDSRGTTTYQQAIDDIVREFNESIDQSGKLINEDSKAKMSEHIRNSLIHQQLAAMRRGIGDHGIRHIRGNIARSETIMQNKKGELTPEDRISLILACVHHDEGYSTATLDKGIFSEGYKEREERHDERSAALFSEYWQNGPYKGLLDDNQFKDITAAIATHNHNTLVDMNDANDLIVSVHLADKLALFEREKAPELLLNSPRRVELVQTMLYLSSQPEWQQNKENRDKYLEQFKEALIADIKNQRDLEERGIESDSRKISELEAEYLIHAVEHDIRLNSGVYSLGMLAGEIPEEFIGDEQGIHTINIIQFSDENVEVLKDLGLYDRQVKKAMADLGFFPPEVLRPAEELDGLDHEGYVAEMRLYESYNQIVQSKLKLLQTQTYIDNVDANLRIVLVQDQELEASDHRAKVLASMKKYNDKWRETHVNAQVRQLINYSAAEYKDKIENQTFSSMDAFMLINRIESESTLRSDCQDLNLKLKEFYQEINRTHDRQRLSEIGKRISELSDIVEKERQEAFFQSALTKQGGDANV